LRANVLEEFWEQMRKHAGDKLIWQKNLI
jgi:hypothetical protein